MIKRLSIFAVCLILLLNAESKDMYELSPLLIGADAMGRGEAYLGGSDSNHYVFQNYSFLGENVTPRVSLTVFKLISEINYLSAAYSQDRFALGFLYIGDTGGYRRDPADNIMGGRIGYSDVTLYGAYAFQFDKYNLGTRLKYHSKYFSEVDTSAWGMSLDLAGHYSMTDHLTLGAELGNAAGTTLKWSNGYEEKIPLNFSIGGQFKLLGPEGFLQEQEYEWLTRRTDVYADLRVEERNALLKTGVEFWPHEQVALRAGLRQINDIQEGKNARLWRLTAGAGFNWKGFHFDYAYHPGDEIGENMTHFFTISYRFPAPELPTPSIEVVELRQRMFVDIDDYSLDEIYMMEDLGYLGFMIGYPGHTFEPEQPLTRKELMTVLVRLEEETGRPFVAENIMSFADVRPTSSHTIRNTARRASGTRYNLLRGYPDGEARLEIPVLRSEAGAAFVRYEGHSGEEPLLDNALRYRDVPRNHWAYKDITLSKQYGLTQGVSGNRYEPNVYMKRLDAARILSRMRHIQEKRLELPPIEGLGDWQDISRPLSEQEYKYIPPIPPAWNSGDGGSQDYYQESDKSEYLYKTRPVYTPPPPVEESYYYEEYDEIDELDEIIDLNDFINEFISEPEAPQTQAPPPKPQPQSSPPQLPVTDEDDWFIDLEY